MKSLEELRQIKESARQMMHLRDEGKTIRIVVGMGTCGIAAGARETLAAIMQELEQRKLLDVVITQTGCAGRCDEEPLVDIILPNEARVTYGRVDAERARQIIASHIVEGKIVSDYVINR
ncbi:MAG: (2Fe-2S) ferredoxin domain-containing protein [Bacillota bacterium]